MRVDGSAEPGIPILAADWRRRLRWGARLGAGMGGFLALWGLVVFLVGNAGAFAKGRITLLVVLMLYALGGLVGGAAVGLALPLVRRSLGSALVGALAVLPIGTGLAVSVGGFTWTVGHSVVVVSLALFVGAPVGVVYAHFWASDIRRAERVGKRIAHRPVSDTRDSTE